MFHAEVELAYSSSPYTHRSARNFTWGCWVSLEANVGLDEIIYPQRNVALKHDVSFGDMSVSGQPVLYKTLTFNIVTLAFILLVLWD